MSEQKNTSSVDISEIEKFTKMADNWWDKEGPFKPLHNFNPIRVEYITQKICDHLNIERSADCLKNINFLDVGCGGGLLCEPIRRLGGNVTGIDAAEKNIKIASIHSEKSNLDIDYRNITVEELVKENKKFDIVLTMEVVEHVADVENFLKNCSKLVKPNGLLFVATLNRTLKSFALAIVGAEYVLRWLPIGTHEWKKFLKPSEISTYVTDKTTILKESQGVSFNPLNKTWSLSGDLSVNYMMLFKKD